MGNHIKKDGDIFITIPPLKKFLATSNGATEADNLLRKGRWPEKFIHWGAITWCYIPTQTEPAHLVLLIYVNDEHNISFFPMSIGTLEVAAVVVRTTK